MNLLGKILQLAFQLFAALYVAHVPPLKRCQLGVEVLELHSAISNFSYEFNTRMSSILVDGFIERSVRWLYRARISLNDS